MSYILPVLAAILDLRLPPTATSIDISSIVFLDLENVGVAVGIAVLSCIEAEILRYFLSTSGYGGHL